MSDEEARENSALVEAASHNDVDTNIPKKSYVQLLNVWPGKSKHAVRTVLKCYLHMAESLTSPGIVFALLCASIVLGITPFSTNVLTLKGCAIGLSLTYNNVLENVYGWPAENVGLINVCPMKTPTLTNVSDRYYPSMFARNGICRLLGRQDHSLVGETQQRRAYSRTSLDTSYLPRYNRIRCSPPLWLHGGQFDWEFDLVGTIYGLEYLPIHLCLDAHYYDDVCGRGVA